MAFSNYTVQRCIPSYEKPACFLFCVEQVVGLATLIEKATSNSLSPRQLSIAEVLPEAHVNPRNLVKATFICNYLQNNYKKLK